MLKRNYREDAIALNCFLIVLALLTFLSCGTSTSNTGSVRPTQDFLNIRPSVNWSQVSFSRGTRTEEFGSISFTPVQARHFSEASGARYALVEEFSSGIPVTLVNSVGYPYYHGVTIASQQQLSGYFLPATQLDNQGNVDSSTPLFAIIGVYNDYEVIPFWKVGGDGFFSSSQTSSDVERYVHFYCKNPDVYIFYHNNITGYVLCYSETNTEGSWYTSQQIERRCFIVVYNNIAYVLNNGTGDGSPLLFSIDSNLFAYSYFSGIEGDYCGHSIIEIGGNGLAWSYDMSP